MNFSISTCNSWHTCWIIKINGKCTSYKDCRSNKWCQICSCFIITNCAALGIYSTVCGAYGDLYLGLIRKCKEHVIGNWLIELGIGTTFAEFSELNRGLCAIFTAS